MDNELIENSLYGIHYSIQQLILKVDEQEKKINYLLENISIIEQGLSSIQMIQQNITQISNDIELLKSEKTAPELVLTPKTQVVLNPQSTFTNQQQSGETTKDNIKWDRRESEETPESTFGFKIPNALNE